MSDSLDNKDSHSSSESSNTYVKTEDDIKNEETTSEQNMLDVISRAKLSGIAKSDGSNDDSADIAALKNQQQINSTILATPIVQMPPSLLQLLNSSKAVTNPNFYGPYEHDEFKPVYTIAAPRVAQFNERRISFNAVPKMGRMCFVSTDKKLALIVREVYLSTVAPSIDINGYVVLVDNINELQTLGNDGVITNVKTRAGSILEQSTGKIWNNVDEDLAITYTMNNLVKPVNHYSFYYSDVTINLQTIHTLSVNHGGFNYASLSSYLGI